MGEYSDRYNIKIDVEGDKSVKKVEKLNDVLEETNKAFGRSKAEGKAFIRNMSDKDFKNVYQNFNKISNGIHHAGMELRFLSRGFDGFRMDMLNVLFLGMQLQSTFMPLMMGTAMGGIFGELMSVFAELTIGQSRVVELMVDKMISLIEWASNNPESAKV